MTVRVVLALQARIYQDWRQFSLGIGADVSAFQCHQASAGSKKMDGCRVGTVSSKLNQMYNKDDRKLEKMKEVKEDKKHNRGSFEMGIRTLKQT